MPINFRTIQEKNAFTQNLANRQGLTFDEANLISDILATDPRMRPAESQLRNAISRTRFGDIQTIERTFGGLLNLAEYVAGGGQVQSVEEPFTTTPSGGRTGGQAVLKPTQLGFTPQPRAEVGGQLGTETFGNPAFTGVQQVLNKLYDQGYRLNPNAQINEKSIDELLAIASKEIDPYYQTQIKLASDDLKRSLGYTQEQLLQGEADLERRYGRGVRQIGEQAAETGFALSGRRQLEEQELATETQQAIEQGRRQLGFQAGGAVGQFTRQFAGLPGFQAPSATLPEVPRVMAGQVGFQRGTRQLPFYELSPETYSGLVGEQEFARRGAIRRRGSELEEAQRLGQSLPLRSINY